MVNMRLVLSFGEGELKERVKKEVDRVRVRIKKSATPLTSFLLSSLPDSLLTAFFSAQQLTVLHQKDH